MDGLHHNGLDYYTHLLTGYIGSAGFLKYIAHVVKQLREVNPDLVYGKTGFTFCNCG
jgi:pyridoxine kinase